MSTLIIFTLAILLCAVLAGWLLYKRKRCPHLPWRQLFPGANTRKLSEEERQGIENYLSDFNHNRQMPVSGATIAPTILTLNSQSATVYSLTRSVTRYSIATDDPHKWRYFLDCTEVHLPPFWEQYITDENNLDLIVTNDVPLIIGLNGYSLTDYRQDNLHQTLNSPSTQASIRGEEREQIDLLNTRQETPEEHALIRPNGLREALLIVAAFLLFYCCLIVPSVFVPWIFGSALLFLGAGCWGLYAPPPKSSLREIHCLRGTPKRWGLFGENDQEQINNISLGIIDLVYPRHWQPFIARDLGQKTDIDIYLNRHVVRQGRFLSLHDEVKHFPLQHWLRSTIIASGSLLVVVMMWSCISLNMPFKFTLSWLKGAQTIEANTVQELEQMGVHIGDTLYLKGTGMCSIHPQGALSTQEASPFLPFDCSKIIWNNSPPPSLPESEMVDKASALAQSVNRQLHPLPDDNSRVSPALRSAIQKSGMILLDDFADIVLKTQALCASENECVRLKNALVNLGNTRNWGILVKRAKSGKLNGINVLLRPISAESLENLVNNSTAPFILSETARAAQMLNTPEPGGFLIINDEGSDFATQPYPTTSLYDYPVREQWNAFKRLASTLMQTPFYTEGIVTNVYTDTTGTQHINLHRLPDSSGLWNYLSTTLLMLSMIICTVYNSIQAIRRYHRHQKRLAAIVRYYESCTQPMLLSDTGDYPSDFPAR